METYTKQDVIGILLTAIGEGGTSAAFARRNHISPQYVSDVLSERREPGPKLLSVLGLERNEPTYRKKSKGKKQ